jgi:hypothetical protein
MRKWLFANVLFVASAASSLMAADPGDKVAASLVENGHRRVAVLPTVISRRGDVESTTGELGARGPLMSKELYKKLVSTSQQGEYRGKFQVVQERSIRSAIKARGFEIEDLGDAEKVKTLAKDVGADALITLTHDESTKLNDVKVVGGEKPAFDVVNAETIDAKDNFSTYSQDFADDRTLGKAAYGGESWELRRWQDGKFENLGIDLDGSKAFGKGNRWEQWQYQRLKSDLPHPRDVSDFPYVLNVVVGGQVRKPKAVEGVHGKQYVVELNPGEVYSLEIENQSDKPVFMLLYVDGVCTIDKMRAEPEDMELFRHWFVKAKSGARKISGWHVVERDNTKKPTKTQYYDEFKVVPKEDSVAAGLGGDVEIGMITAVYYTVGMDGITQPKDEELKSRSLPQASFGTGTGERKDKMLEFPPEGNKPRGIILGAQTIYYRTGDQIRNILGGNAEEDLAMTAIEETKE